MSQLPDFKNTFPQWQRREWDAVVPTLDASGCDLLAQMLVYEPSKRVSARVALSHPFFDDQAPGGAAGAGPSGASPMAR